MRKLLVITLLFSVVGCAPFWQVRRIEDKVDRLVQNTNRSTLTQIFGEQATAINQKMESLSWVELAARQVGQGHASSRRWSLRTCPPEMLLGSSELVPSPQARLMR